MNVNELKDKNLGELKEKLAEVQKHQFDLRMAKGNGQLTKGHLLKEVRRDIARVKTQIREQLIKSKDAGNK